jgi:methylenetetrahydrofolate dehydrogenase (NADP+)/methenyltetrahydrofolate cyclohydrolase
MQILDGKRLAQEIKDELRAEVAQLTASGRRPPFLAAVLVGEDPASQSYVRHKTEACAYAGIGSEVIRRPGDIPQEALLDIVRQLNEDEGVDGFIVQLPLPAHIEAETVLASMLPRKDVDGFHPVNVGRMTLGLSALLPATPKGIVEMIRRFGIETRGKHCVVVGRSRIVGRPVSVLLSGAGEAADATVTLCHSRTPAPLLRLLCLQADILVAATGRPGSIGGDMVKPGAVVIDVGTTRVEAPGTKLGYRLQGDVDFESAAARASWITPVPGGVGPMTVVSLLQNTLETYRTHYLHA